MELGLRGKVFLVTGAGSGIGFTCARLLAESEAQVAMVGRRKEKIDAAAELVGAGATPYACDLSQVEKIHELVTLIRKDLGEIQGLIQCVGRPYRLGRERAMESWNLSLENNAKSMYAMMLEVVEQSMLPQKDGAIVNISSMAGIRGILPPMSDFAYSASKGAVNALTRQGAVLWGRQGIRVNAIAPGGVISGGVGISDKAEKAPDDPSLPYLDMIPSGRHSLTEEIAGTACFLCSDYSRNTMGQILAVDGGASIIGM